MYAARMKRWNWNSVRKWPSRRTGDSRRVKHIGALFCWRCVDWQWHLPDSIETIGFGAFRHCCNLTAVTIGKSVKAIGDCAFFDCDKLESVTIAATSLPATPLQNYEGLRTRLKTFQLHRTLYVPKGCVPLSMPHADRGVISVYWWDWGEAVRRSAALRPARQKTNTWNNQVLRSVSFSVCSRVNRSEFLPKVAWQK